MKVQAALFVLLALPMTVQAETREEAQASAARRIADRKEDLYNRLYPYYAELCSVTQLSRRDGHTGGPGGHAVLYLKGACTTPSGTNGIPVPQIKVCDDNETELENGELKVHGRNQGVGLSVNKTFENANWVATTGRDLLVYGNLTPDQKFDKNYMEALARKIAPNFEGMTSTDTTWTKAPADFTQSEKMAINSIDTDVAITVGRNAYCVKVPLRKDLIADVVNEYNRINQVAYQKFVESKEIGGERFAWSGFYNNCTHTAYNAIAATGIFTPKAINANPIKQVFNLAFPSEVFRYLTELGTKDSLNDVSSVYGDDELRNSLANKNFLPTRPGGLVSRTYWHKNNDIYGMEVCKDKKSRKQVDCAKAKPGSIVKEIDLPTGGYFAIGNDGANMLTNKLRFSNMTIPAKLGSNTTSKFMENAVNDPNYTDVLANLDFFVAKYRKALSKVDTESGEASLRDFSRLYQSYLEKELAEARDLQTLLRTAE